MLSETKVQQGLLIFIGAMSEKMLETMNSFMDEHNKNAFIYMAYNEIDTSSPAGKEERPYRMNWSQVNKKSFAVAI